MRQARQTPQWRFASRQIERERLLPRDEGGGYAFAFDHFISNSVLFENMKEIAEPARWLGKY
jgi:hypothetical protein